MATSDNDNFNSISWHSDHQTGGPSSTTMGGGSGSARDRGGNDSSDEAGLPSPSNRQHQLGDDMQPNFARMEGALNVGDWEKLECTVTQPLKENDGGRDSFTSYLVTTNSTFPFFQKPTFSTRRRFSDFLFLYKALCREFPASAVPPVPDKQRMVSVTGDRFGPDFVQRRAHSLQRFLTRCALHPMLRRAEVLHNFLESQEWNATMRSRQSRSSSAADEGGKGGARGEGGGGGGGVFDAFADSFINAFTKVHKPDRRFIEVRERSDRLDEDLGHVEKVVARVARREADIEADYRDLAEQFQRLVALEPGVEPAVLGFSASVEDTAQGLRRLRDVTDQDYLGSLRDMAAYSGALKSLLKAREQKQLDHEQLTEYLNKSSSERDNLAAAGSGSYYGGAGGGGALGLASAGKFIQSKIEDVRGVDHEQSRRERQRRLELRIDELTTEVERARRQSEMFDEEVVRETKDFERIKRVEFRQQLGGLADAHIAYYDQVGEIWERYVKEMEKEGVLAA